MLAGSTRVINFQCFNVSGPINQAIFRGRQNSIHRCWRASLSWQLNPHGRLPMQRTLPPITTNRVIEDDYPILVVSHDDDGDWQFMCGTTDETADGRIVALHEIVNSHPSVVELADLPLGWQAVRDAPDEPWRRHRK